MTSHKNIFVLFGFLFTSAQICAMEAVGPFVGYKNNNLNVPSLFSLSLQALLNPYFLNNLDLESPMPESLQALEFLGHIQNNDDIKSSLLTCCSKKVLWGALEPLCIQTLKGHTDSVQSVAVIDKNHVFTASDYPTAQVWDITYYWHVPKDPERPYWLGAFCSCD